MGAVMSTKVPPDRRGATTGMPAENPAEVPADRAMDALAAGRLPDAPHAMPEQAIEPRSVSRMRSRLRARLRMLMSSQRGSAEV